MDNATSSLSTFYVQATQNMSMATSAVKREQMPTNESISMLCNAMLELKSQVSTLTTKLAQLLDGKTSSQEPGKEVAEEVTSELKPKLLTIDETAQYLNLSKHTIYKMTQEHRVRFYKPTGKRIYFDVADLDEWMKSRAIKSNAETEADATNYVMFGKRPVEKKPELPDDERTIRNRQLAQEIRRKYNLK